MGNTIYIMTKPKFLRRSKTKFCLIMAHPQCNEDTIEYVLFSYGFRKKKER